MRIPANCKERTDSLIYNARRLVVESGVDVNEPVTILPLAKQLMVETGCGIDAAKRRIAQAVRRARGEIVQSTHGGKREYKTKV